MNGTQTTSDRRFRPDRQTKVVSVVSVASTMMVAILAIAGTFPVVAQTQASSSVLDLSATDIHGDTVSLSQYRGEVLLIVNTASKCGFTDQYEGLQNLYDRYRGDGFVVLGFPSDSFFNQEFGSDEEILDFCEMTFAVSFPLFSKVAVVGADAHPVFRYLTERETAGEFSGRISWNFNKFLIDREGRIIARFGTRVEPEDPKVIAAIEGAL